MPVNSLPRLGLGTDFDTPEDARENVLTALDLGYKHFDTAQMYGTEQYVGEAINASNVEREDVFLATKTVDPDRPDDPSDVRDAIDRSIERLGVDYVDLFYIHWPAGVYDPETVLPQFEQAVRDEKIRNIGVANFTTELLNEARDVLDVPIAAHQVELHPLLRQKRLLEYAREHDHWLVAYCPVARGEIFDHPEIVAIGEKHGVSPAQVSLGWLLSKDNVAAIPKSGSEAHMRENFESSEIELDDEDIERIDRINREYRVVDPDHSPWNKV